MKQSIIKFRLSNLEKKLIEKRAEKAGMKVSEYCRKTALGIEIKERLSVEEIEFYKMFVKFNNNFSFISNLIKNKDAELLIKINDLADEMKLIISTFRK